MSRWTRHGLMYVIALICAAGMVSCETDGWGGEMPNMSQVEGGPELQPPPDELPPPKALITVDRIDLPLNRSLESAWSLVDEQVAPPLRMGMWQTNGLRIGLIGVDQIQSFVESLPQAYAARRSQIVSTDHPTPIRRSPRLLGDVLVDMTVPPMSPREIEIHGGRVQLQSRVVRDDAGLALLEMVPHHYVPRAALLPRDPLEKELDGRFFDELAMRVNVPADRVLVIGLYWPWPDAEVQAPSAAAGGADAEVGHPEVAQMLQTVDDEPQQEQGPAQESETPVSDEADPQPTPPDTPLTADQPPPLRNTIGRAMMTAVRQNRPIQILLLVSVDPIEPNAPPADSTDAAGQ